MKSRKYILAFSVAGVVASLPLPASAQVADFFCSTFSVGCEPAPPPPPPAPLPVAEEVVPKKKVRHAKAKPKHTVAPKTADSASGAEQPK